MAHMATQQALPTCSWRSLLVSSLTSSCCFAASSCCLKSRWLAKSVSFRPRRNSFSSPRRWSDVRASACSQTENRISEIETVLILPPSGRPRKGGPREARWRSPPGDQSPALSRSCCLVQILTASCPIHPILTSFCSGVHLDQSLTATRPVNRSSPVSAPRTAASGPSPEPGLSRALPPVWS